MKLFNDKTEIKLLETIENNKYNEFEKVLKNVNNKIINLNKPYKILSLSYKMKLSIFSFAIFKNNIEMVISLINYANEKDIILEINNKNEKGNYPLLNAIVNNNIELIKLLIDYAKGKNIIFDINGKDENGNYPLLIIYL